MKFPKNKKIYCWHFWIPKWKAQIIIDNSSYSGAIKHIKSIIKEKAAFQFGQII